MDSAVSGCQSVERALAILELFEDDRRPLIAIGEAARELGVHRSTASRLLATLEAGGLLELDEAAGGYRLGLGLVTLAGHVLNRFPVRACAAPVLRELRAETQTMPHAQMQIGADQGRFMQLMAHMVGAKKYVEIGVFTGYSSLVMALALPKDGHILACDVSEEYTNVARRYWQKAGVADKIDLQLAPAVQTLDRVITAEAGTYDIAFIDADKTSANAYYERCLQLLRPGGLIMVDNTLWNGAVADPSDTDADTVALRAITKKAMSDSRVDAALTAIGDGLLLVRKN